MRPVTKMVWWIILIILASGIFFVILDDEDTKGCELVNMSTFINR